MKRLLVLLALALLIAACGDGVGPDDVDSEALVGSVGELEESVSGETRDPAVWDSEVTASDDPIQRATAEASEQTEAGDDEVVVIEDQSAKPEVPVVQPTPEPPPAPTGEVPQSLLDAILADASSRADGPLIVVRAQSVTWSDGSLGCPEPGMMYTQALEDGYWVVVDANGVPLDYRASSSGAFKFCAFGGEPPAGPGDT